ncbi:hypothetical protein [Chryseosolibacter indicus]|uniref:DUF4221 domain-containing protein n=1 Tax=Chryseosolibacter indicus TaxID=2782351 RepID=A0ABS5VSP4_9BACT|nr:hypothetical protein [Chryseosolibacter indicus]MBT1704458.1 hypothetical protein [Chryseosolibacter indicus]
MKKKILGLGVVILVSMLFVLTAFLISGSDKMAHGGFTRDFIGTRELALVSRIDLQSSGYYFAGRIGEVLYFGVTTSPFHLLKITGDTKEIIHIKRSLADSVRMGKVIIEYPHFYLADLENYNIYRGETADWSCHEVVHHKLFFTEYLPANHSVFLRLFNDEKTELILAKRNATNFGLKKSSLLEKQIDGIFCTDGVLKFDDSSGTLVYTYFYRNQFICADTSLRPIYRGNTIDTTRHAKMSVAKVYMSSYSAMSSPPHIVNRRAYVSKNLLFINSNIRADNEEQKTFEAMNVLDIYDLRTGKYLKSFYVPRISTNKLRHFFVIDNIIYSIQDNYLLLHRLNMKQTSVPIDSGSLSLPRNF